MPRIPDEHLQAVVFIYPSQEAAERGDQVGGTGFVVDRLAPRGAMRARYVVTNQHVVDSGGHWVRVNRVGGMHVQHVGPDEWIHAPDGDDFAVAVLPLPDSNRAFHLTLETLALTRLEALALRVGLGDEVYMVGRFIAHGGQVTNNPIARFGNISLMPDEQDPVIDGREKAVAAYLIEMRSHVGFSGSPVFVYIPHNSFRGTFGDASMDDNVDRFRLLGIDTGHKIERLPVGQRDATTGGFVPNTDKSYVQHYRDVAIVAPIWKVVDLLDREDLVQRRAEAEEDWIKLHGREEAISDMSVTTENESDEQASTGPEG